MSAISKIAKGIPCIDCGGSCIEFRDESSLKFSDDCIIEDLRNNSESGVVGGLCQKCQDETAASFDALSATDLQKLEKGMEKMKNQ